MHKIPYYTLARSADILAAVPNPDAWLTLAERQRTASFLSAAARDDYLAGHLLVRMLAADWIGCNAASLQLVQLCTVCGGAHGRPQLSAYPDIHISISHSDGIAAAAVAAQPVAIDIERMSAPLHIAELINDVVFASAELAHIQALKAVAADVETTKLITQSDIVLLRTWVRKETFVKLGRLTLDTLATLDLSQLEVEQDWASSQSHNWTSWYEGLALTDFIASDLAVVGTVLSSEAAWRRGDVADLNGKKSIKPAKVACYPSLTSEC